MELRPAAARNILRMIAATQPVEIDCDECFQHLDRYAEQSLAGENAAEAMPLVSAHLELCPDCRQELEILLVMLGAGEVPAE